MAGSAPPSTRAEWADIVDDSSQENSQNPQEPVVIMPEDPVSQVSQSSYQDPAQLYPSTPESLPAEAMSQLSQGSICAQPHLYPSTPDSFDGSQTGLTQEFRAIVTIEQPEQQPHQQLPTIPDVDTAFPAEQPMPEVAFPQNLSLAGAIPQQQVDAPSSSWNIHGLMQPAVAIAKAASPDRAAKQKRQGGYSPAKTPAEKRQRPNSTLNAAASSSSSSAPADEEVVTEADRQRRREKRINGIAAVRKSPEYLYLASLWDRSFLVGPPPAKHDPLDESVSKRAWEKGMELWRHEVRQLAAQHGYRAPPQALPS